MVFVMKFGEYDAVISFDSEFRCCRGEFISLNGGADFYADSIENLRKDGSRVEVTRADITPRKIFMSAFQSRLLARQTLRLNQAINEIYRKCFCGICKYSNDHQLVAILFSKVSFNFYFPFSALRSNSFLCVLYPKSAIRANESFRFAPRKPCIPVFLKSDQARDSSIDSPPILRPNDME